VLEVKKLLSKHWCKYHLHWTCYFQYW